MEKIGEITFVERMLLKHRTEANNPLRDRTDLKRFGLHVASDLITYNFHTRCHEYFQVEETKHTNY